MNDTPNGALAYTAAAGSAGLLPYPGYTPIPTVERIENGFLVTVYITKQSRFYCADLEAVKSKLQEIFS